MFAMTDSPSKASITIKKYANRRLYNTATSTYVTLENLGVMVKEGTEFNVYDAKTGEDLTRSVLAQIIMEEEGKSGQNLLPVGFLRQLIGFYGDNMQWMVPKYLEQSMQVLTKNQDELKGYFQNTLGTIFPFGTTIEEMSKQNLAMFERAVHMFSPFAAMQNAQKAAENGCACEKTATSKEPATENKTSTATATPSPAPATVAATPMATAPKETAKPAETPTAPTDISTYRAATATPTITKPASDESADEMQQKISNLQKQLAELAKKRG
jgi:polyhydroxyalkanoate synthesis repressor PhaR